MEITEEPYDGPVATALVEAFMTEMDVRYAHATAEWTEEEVAEDLVDYRAEVTPELVSAPDGAFFVAWVDGEAAGCGALKALKPTDPARRVGEIKRMYTAPDARRRGVSRAILAALEERAIALGYERLQLETGTAQPEAIALYQSAGWQQITPYGRYKDILDSVCFAKDLTPP